MTCIPIIRSRITNTLLIYYRSLDVDLSIQISNKESEDLLFISTIITMEELIIPVHIEAPIRRYWNKSPIRSQLANGTKEYSAIKKNLLKHPQRY